MFLSYAGVPNREEREEPLRLWLVVGSNFWLFLNSVLRQETSKNEQCSSGCNHYYYMLLPLLSLNRQDGSKKFQT